MKNFILYSLFIVAILGAIFTYILYSEGFFEKQLEPSELKPFEMKCEAEKCASGKCASAK